VEDQQTDAATTPDKTETTPADDTFKSEESKQAVLADLAKERDRRQSLESRLAELEAEAEKARKAQMSESERALAEAVDAARAEERAKFAHERLESRVRATAARLLRDPEDAVRLLDTSGIDVDSADVGSEIESRLSALVEAKPYLAAGETPKASGSGDAISRPSNYQPTVGALLKAARGR